MEAKYPNTEDLSDVDVIIRDAEVLTDDDGRPIVETYTCGTCGRSWNNAAVSSMTPTPAGRCPWESEHDTPATTPTQTLTLLEFSPEDHDKSDRIAAALGYGENTAYTSTSDLWGLFCLPENPAHAKPGQRTTGGCIIKTAELGFLFVQDGEDLRQGYDWTNA